MMKEKRKKEKTKFPQQGTKEAKRLARGTKRVPVQTTLLRTLYATSTIGVALLAPKALKMFKTLDRGKRSLQNTHKRVQQGIHRLIQKGFVEKVNGTYTLTHRGEAEVEKIIIKTYRIPEQALWDGKWRLLIFDIREERRNIRLQLRGLLSLQGFVRLQDSVWVYPYPCDEFVGLVRAHLASGTGELLSLVVESIEADVALRKHFKLL